MKPDAESLYLVDAHSLIFQVFHAIPNMTSPTGLPTNALFGFTKDMMFLRNDRKPTRLLCVFDAPGKTFRDDIAPDYKANRSPMPDDLVLQIPLIHRMLAAMNIPVLSMEGFEADDLIATLACAGAKEGMNVYICTSDKDCRQLLADNVVMFNLRKQEVFDTKSLAADWGVRPDQVVDFQTLVGDSVDNVKGAEGIGPKTATKLLADFGTLDNLMANLDKMTGKRKECLKAFASNLEKTRSLVRLDCAVPISLEWNQWKLGDWNGPDLLELFRGWGFHRFADQVRQNVPAKAAPPSSVQTSLFDDQVDDTPPTAKASNWQATYHLVNTPELFHRFFDGFRQAKRIAIDLETTSLEPHQAEIVGIAICWREGEAWYLALQGPSGETTLDSAEVLAKLKPYLVRETPEKVNQNIKYDWQVFKAHGIHLGGVVGDSMVADYLLHAGERSHGMDVLAEKHLGHRPIPITDLIGKGKKQKSMSDVPLAQIAEYSGEDADVAFRLCDRLEPLLLQEGLRSDRKPPAEGTTSAAAFSLYDDLEVPLIEVLGEMEFTGVRLDVPLLQTMSAAMAKDLTRLEDDLYQLAGKKFNIGSVVQLREILFKEMGLTPEKKTNITGAASTDQETLEALSKQGHEFPRKLLEHRKIAKLKSTYVDALPTLVNPKTGRVHGSFNQTVATTGRLSSSDPNLQNIPIRSDLGGSIRRAFLPEASWILLAADYSQIELRLLAHFSKDENLRKAFAEDADIHTAVAAQIFGVGQESVTSEQRRMAKTVNFGIVYGMSAFGLAQRLEISKDDAAKFIEAYFKTYPNVLQYQESLLRDCLAKGYVRSILGRRRVIAGVRAKTSYQNRNQPEREAINMEIQGSAADLIKVAMLNVSRRLAKEKRRTRMLMQIHDELVFEVPLEEKAEACRLVHEEMTNALSDRLEVPIRVDMGMGPNWLDTQEVTV